MISSRTAAFSFGNSSFSTPYVVGIVLSLGVALFARRVGLDRDRGWIVVGGLAGTASLMPFTAPFCLAYDVGAAVGLAWLIRRRPGG
jgi:hypothetical protein